MTQLLGISILFVCCTIANGGWLDTRVAGSKPDLVEVYKLIDGKELDLHVFYPGPVKPARPAPAIVMFHGGGFLESLGFIQGESTVAAWTDGPGKQAPR